MLQPCSVLLLVAASAETQDSPQPPAISAGRCSPAPARYTSNLRRTKPAEPGEVVNNRSEGVSSLSNVFRTPSFSFLFRQRETLLLIWSRDLGSTEETKAEGASEVSSSTTETRKARAVLQVQVFRRMRATQKH